jgi:hypothetical protein
LLFFRSRPLRKKKATKKMMKLLVLLIHILITFQPSVSLNRALLSLYNKSTILIYISSFLTFIIVKIGKAHPDAIVETASLSSVAPPEVYYKLKLPSKIVDRGLLSALQLEAVVYACQQHEFFLRSGQRAGYLVGDGAGVGKGRTIAGIIYENWLSGRKRALWVSVSADLKEDSIRDLKDIGAGKLPVIALNKLKYGRISKIEHPEGVLFSTYSGLIGESSTGGKFNARFKQITDWLGPGFEGLVSSFFHSFCYLCLIVDSLIF